MDLLSPPQDVSCLVIEQRIFLIPVLKQSKKFSRVKELKEEFLIWVSYFPNSQESKSNTFCFFKKLSKSRTECDMEELVILNLSTEAHKNNMARTSTASELFQMVCQKPFDNICKSIYCVNKYIDWIFKMCLRQEESRLGKTYSLSVLSPSKVQFGPDYFQSWLKWLRWCQHPSPVETFPRFTPTMSGGSF